MLVFLIGMPGAGKSFVSRQLHALKGWEMVDTDRIIEEREGKGIGQIFAEEGETYFRGREREILADVIEEGGSKIISTGGGMPCFGDNMELMNAAGLTIFLDFPLQLLAERIATSRHTDRRPHFRGMEVDEVRDQLAVMMGDRIEHYSKAKLRYSEAPLAVEVLAEDIESYLD